MEGNFFRCSTGFNFGPLLFSIYVNDLPSVVPDINVRMYADDTVVFTSAKTVDGLNLILSTAMCKIYIWLCANRICLNLSKSVSMVISTQSRGQSLPSLLVSVNGSCLACVDNYKYLGVYVDRYLTWSFHVDKMICRAKARFSVIRRALPIPPDTILSLYKAFVLPCFDYCDVVWNPTQVGLSNLIDRFHQRVFTLVGDSANFGMQQSLKQRRQFHLAIQVFKCEGAIFG